MEKIKTVFKECFTKSVSWIKGNKKIVGIISAAIILVAASLLFMMKSTGDLSASVIGGYGYGQTNDLTPRIMTRPGKVNQHFDGASKQRQSDPDGVAGAQIPALSYCKKWYPKTVSIRGYKNETISTWRDRGNLNAYAATRLSTECVQQAPVSVSLVVAKQANPGKDLSTSALRLMVTNVTNQTIAINQLLFKNVFNGYTGSTTLMVYRDQINSANVVAKSAPGLGFSTTSLALTGNGILIDPLMTVTYIVTLQGAILGANNAGNWTVSLTDVVFGGGKSAASIPNSGLFPLTEMR